MPLPHSRRSTAVDANSAGVELHRAVVHAPDAKQERLEERIGVRLRSRLAEMADRIDFTGATDYRRNRLG